MRGADCGPALIENRWARTLKVDRHPAATVLTADELDALLDAVPSARYSPVWSIQRWTAARIGECLALTWRDLNGAVTFRRANTKTKTTRQIPTAARLEAELQAYRVAWSADTATSPLRERSCSLPKAALIPP